MAGRLRFGDVFGKQDVVEIIGGVVLLRSCMIGSPVSVNHKLGRNSEISSVEVEIITIHNLLELI